MGLQNISSGGSSFGVHAPLGMVPGENGPAKGEEGVGGESGMNGADFGERRHCDFCESGLHEPDNSGLKHCLESLVVA